MVEVSLQNEILDAPQEAFGPLAEERCMGRFLASDLSRSGRHRSGRGCMKVVSITTDIRERSKPKTSRMLRAACLVETGADRRNAVNSEPQVLWSVILGACRIMMKPKRMTRAVVTVRA